ncbi:hypothetical protein Dimus_019510 [Dionaea muscipula]
MAKLFMVSQSSLLLLDFQSHSTMSRWSSGAICCPRSETAFHHNSVSMSRDKSAPVAAFSIIPLAHSQQNPGFWKRIGAVTDSNFSDLKIEREEAEAELVPAAGSGGGFGDDGNNKDRGGGGGGGGGGDNDNDNDNEGGSENSGGDEKVNALSMSQKLTLAYAALVGLGGVMGYLKSGSQKSLAAGGLSALLLYFVYTQLPRRPVLASCVGLGLSAALLYVMGSRFKRSRKIFPAGVVSLVSLVMTGGYLHGIMRTMH